MTWKELAEKINSLPQEKQEQEATALLVGGGEVHPIVRFVQDWKKRENNPDSEFTPYNDEEIAASVDMAAIQLKEGSPYLTVEN